MQGRVAVRQNLDHAVDEAWDQFWSELSPRALQRFKERGGTPPEPPKERGGEGMGEVWTRLEELIICAAVDRAVKEPAPESDAELVRYVQESIADLPGEQPEPHRNTVRDVLKKRVLRDALPSSLTGSGRPTREQARQRMAALVRLLREVDKHLQSRQGQVLDYMRAHAGEREAKAIEEARGDERAVLLKRQKARVKRTRRPSRIECASWLNWIVQLRAWEERSANREGHSSAYFG